MAYTPYFPGLRAVCAPSGRRSLQKAQRASSSLSGLAGLFKGFLPVWLQVKPKKGAGSRNRLASRVDVFFAFLMMVLNRGASTRSAVAFLQANRVAAGLLPGSNSTSGFCQARLAIPVRWLSDIFAGIGSWFERSEREGERWWGRRVRLLDGSCFSMPDTAANRAKYPIAAGQKRGCGFPVGKFAGLFCLHTGRMLGFVFDTWKRHDLTLARKLLGFLKRGDLLVADRAYGAWSFLAILEAAGVDYAIRLHQARKLKRNRAGCWEESWPKPQRPKGETKRFWDGLPELLNVRIVAYRVKRRGFRSHLVYIVTSLRCKTEFPNAVFEELYGLRWQVELHFRQIKVSLGLDVLRCESPPMIERELWMHAIAYNLIRALMVESARTLDVAVSEMSFKGTVSALLQWERIAFARPRRIREFRAQLLARIASDIVPRRPGRSEPRAKKRRPKNYPLLTISRKRYRVAPSRAAK
jgi:Transposase DDE domain